MAKKTAKNQTRVVSRLDEEPYASMLSRTRDKAFRALEHHGEPKISLEQLKDATASLRLSLSEAVLSERHAGW